MQNGEGRHFVNYVEISQASLGGGGTSILCAYWVRAILETPIFSPKLPLQSISFSQITKNPLRCITILQFFVAPETIIFKISLPSSRFIAADGRFTATSAPGLQPARVPARRVLQVSSGDPHFSLCRGTYLPKCGPSAPPPGGGGGGAACTFSIRMHKEPMGNVWVGWRLIIYVSKVLKRERNRRAVGGY